MEEGKKEAAAPARSRTWTAGGCANMVRREAEKIWAAAGTAYLLATHDADDEARRDFYFHGFARFLDDCGGQLAEIADELEKVDERVDAVLLEG